MTAVTEKDLQPNHKSLWTKATSAANVKNWDYVTSLMPPMLEQLPGFLEGRKLLRHAEIQQFRAKGTKKGFLTMTSSAAKARSAGKKDPAAGMAEVEKLLLKEPFHADANQALYDFAMALGLPDLAAFALETIRSGHPENTKVAHQLAEHYLAQDQPDKAVGVYNAILKVNPSDLKAQTASNQSAARASMKKTGIDQGGDMRSLLKNADEARKIEEANRAGMTREQMETQLAEWSERYAEDQTNVNVVRKIAGLYEQLEQWAEAHSFYAYALSLSPGDTGLERRTLNAEQKAAEAYLQGLEQQIAATEDEGQRAELQAYLDQAKLERAQNAVAEARTRVERNPTDPHLRLELAEHLYSLGEFSEAIPHLQRARTNPAIRARALLLLGRAFEGKNMFDMASTTFEEALADLNNMDSTKKDLLYATALVYEKQGKQAEYLECLKKIYEVDYHFRDVAERVESSYAG